MTSPAPYRVVLGLRVPLAFVPRIVRAMRATYPEVTEGIEDPDTAVRAALRAWVIETVAHYEKSRAMAPLDVAIAQLVTDYEAQANAARDAALAESAAIVDDVPPDPPPA